MMKWKRNQLKKEEKKLCQLGLTYQTYDPGYEIGITHIK